MKLFGCDHETYYLCYIKQSKTIFKSKIMKATKTYDIHFNDSENSSNKGFAIKLDDAKSYISRYNGTNESYFADYNGGTVSIVCNETGETVYEEEVTLR